MAQLALLLYLAFVFITLRHDAKEGRHVSRALWIPFLWLAISASQPLSGWLSPGSRSFQLTEAEYMQGNPIERFFLVIMLSVGLALLSRRAKRVAYYFRDNFFIYLLYFYAFISIGWSDFQGMSLRRWIRAAGDVIMVLLILTEDDQRDAIVRVLRRCAILLIPLSFVYIRYFPQWGIAYHVDGTRMWTGVTNHKNTLGILCAFLGIFLTWRLIKEWRKPKVMVVDGFLLILALYLLRGSHSATSLVVYLIGVMILACVFYYKNDRRKLNSFLIVTVLVLLVLQGIFIYILDVSPTSLFFAATERDSSLTGRIPLWQELIAIGIQKPILGAGYGGIWLSQAALAKSTFTARHKVNAHNGYIHVFLDMGILGLLLMFALIAHNYRRLLKSFEVNWEKGTLLLTLFLMIVFHNITESTFTRGTSFLWILFLLTCIVVVRKARAPDSPETPPA